MAILVEYCKLHCTRGNSDKLYALYHVESDNHRSDDRNRDIYVAYGRRGSSLTIYRKTPQSTSEVRAAREYDDLYEEKIARGYRDIGQPSDEELETLDQWLRSKQLEAITTDATNIPEISDDLASSIREYIASRPQVVKPAKKKKKEKKVTKPKEPEQVQGEDLRRLGDI